MQHTDSFSEAFNLIDSKQNIVILSHTNPDGDAIGSALGLYHFLHNLNKKAAVIVPDDFPDFLQWMPAASSIVVYSNQKDQATQTINHADLIICVDFNSLQRLSKLAELMQNHTQKRILIDHHLEPESFCDVVISNPYVSSTSELICNFIDSCNLTHLINKDAAACFFVGLMTDTGSFSYSCDSPNTYKVASTLIETGISSRIIHNNVYNTFTEKRMRLLGYCLSDGLFMIDDCNTAYIVLTKDILKHFDYKNGDSEGVVNYPLSIGNTVMSVLFIEKDDHIKISFRSKEQFSVNEFARTHFEGGGHYNAAGGTSYLSLNDTITKFKEAVKLYQDKLK